jgi:hypothetical protein
MKLASARELKQELQQLARAHTEVRSFNVRAAPRARAVRLPSPVPVAALGIAPVEGRPKDFRLAMRIYKGQERRARGLIEGRKLESEMNIVTGIRYKPRGSLSLSAGGSCGHVRITAGTLGAFVEDDGGYYILSNNHVLADRDNGMAGDPILQPGPSDIVGKYDVIGTLHRWEPLRSQRVDAALAAFHDDVRYFYPWSYSGIGNITRSPVPDRFGARRVTKRGRTTGVTRGRVSAFELDGVAIDYGSPVGVVSFDDQIEIIGDPPQRPFSQPGDSGSLIIERATRKPYALLYGGGPDASGIDRTVAHFIGDVLDILGVRFVR